MVNTRHRPGRTTARLRIAIRQLRRRPSAGMTLAQLGAEVIRIDPTGARRTTTGGRVGAHRASLYWSALNRGKRSVQIDVRSPQGRELVLALATAPGPDAGIV
ncbi:CoA transferase, partial [Mycolicibacterium insubricum]